MNPLKNIIVLNDFGYVNGGAAQVAISSANAFAELGFRVIFFSAAENADRMDLSARIEHHSTGQYDILHDPSRLRALRQGLWNRKAASRLRAVLQQVDPGESIIHLHGWVKALSPSIGKVLAGSRFSVVCSLHDYFAACPNGGFFNYRRDEVCTLRPLSVACICTNCDARSYSQKSWRVVRQAIQWNVGRIPGGIRHFIAISKFSEAILKPYLPPSANIHVLGNPVSYTLPGRPRADISKKVFLFVGRLSKEKGAALACAAATRIGASLVVIGDGPEKEELKAAYPAAEFRGWQPHTEIFGQMLHSTALIFPSIWYETQGITVMEALSVGLPALISDVTAAKDLVDGQNGLLFKSGETGDLAEKMQTLLLDMDKTEEMSRYAHQKYWNTPSSIHQFIEDSLSIYQEAREKDDHGK